MPRYVPCPECKGEAVLLAIAPDANAEIECDRCHGLGHTGVLAPVRFSSLKQIGRSPAHYLHALENERESKRGQLIGTATHSLVLGGPEVIAYHKTRSGNAWTEFQKEHASKLILSTSEWLAATGCAEAIARHDDARLVLRGAHEVEIPTWRDLGRECGGRPDVTAPDYVTELKTTGRSSDPEWFAREAIRMAYHAQIAWYLHGLREAGGRQGRGYVVAVEQQAPHAVTVLELTPRALLAGEKLCRIWLELLLGCEDSDAWPTYVQSVVPLDVPEADPELVYGDEEEGEAA